MRGAVSEPGIFPTRRRLTKRCVVLPNLAVTLRRYLSVRTPGEWLRRFTLFHDPVQSFRWDCHPGVRFHLPGC